MKVKKPTTEARRHGEGQRILLRLQTATFDEHYWVEQLEENELTENVKIFLSELEEFQG